MRFDEKTRALNACSFAVMTVFSSGISMYAMARLIQALHVFDGLFRALGWAPEGIFHLLDRAVGRHRSALHLSRWTYQRDLQRGAAVLPDHCGLPAAGAAGTEECWRLERAEDRVAAVDPRMMHEWKGVMHSSTNPMGIEIIGIGMGLGFVLGSGYWCTDFLVIQTAMASKNMESARRVPLIAAVPKMVFPFLVILPGLARDLANHAAHHHHGARTERRYLPHHECCAARDRTGQGTGPGEDQPGDRQSDARRQRPSAARLRHGHAEHAAALFPHRHSRARTDCAAGQLHERHGGQRDGVQHGVHLRSLSVLHPQGRQRPALHGGGPMGHGRRHSAFDCAQRMQPSTSTTSWTRCSLSSAL